jgi:diguanylate cyclase
MLADLSELHAMVRPGGQECSLAMIDIDHFKLVNDEFGHVTGDLVLTSIARYLQDDSRQYDRLYRYGGEEFLLCMPNTSASRAVELAERLRVGISALRIQQGVDGPIISTTASFGVAEIDGTQPVEEAIERADQAMYRAKAAGRDCVEAAY